MGYFRIFLYLIVFIIIFSGALFLGVFDLIGVNIDIFTSDFIVFVPVELRLLLFMILLGSSIGILKVFAD